MSESTSSLELRLLAGILRAYQRTNLRGQTRFTLLLARKLKSLQAVAINIADWPPIYMDMRYLDAHSWFLGTPFSSSPLEVNEQSVMRRFVGGGDVVFDIGANLGLHTVLLAQMVGPQGQVVAFEPNSDLLPLLERTVHRLRNVKLYSCALSDENKESLLFVPDDHSMGSLADWTSRKTSTASRPLPGLARTHTLTCQQRRLDELVNADGLPPPDFVKCDVEGAELMVFKGGRQTLDRVDAPIILFEETADTARGFDLKASDAADFLAGLPHPGYRFLEVCGDGSLSPRRPADLGRHNILAVPRAKSGLCPELSGEGSAS